MGYHYYYGPSHLAQMTRDEFIARLDENMVEQMEAQALDTGVSNKFKGYRVEHTADELALTVGQRVWYYACPYTIECVITRIDSDAYCGIKMLITDAEITSSQSDVYPQTVAGARVLKERMAQNAITLTREIGDIATWMLQHSELVQLPLA